MMKHVALILAMILSLTVQAAEPAPASTASQAVNMVTQIPAFLTKIETTRGKALSVAEKAAATTVITEGNNTANGIQTKFLGAVSKASGLDVPTLSLLFPSATQRVSNTDLTGKLEGKMGKKLGYVQKAAVTSANTLRNNSLDGLKTSLTNGVAQKLGMDPALVTACLPLIGF